MLEFFVAQVQDILHQIPVNLTLFMLHLFILHICTCTASSDAGSESGDYSDESSDEPGTSGILELKRQAGRRVPTKR